MNLNRIIACIWIMIWALSYSGHAFAIEKLRLIAETKISAIPGLPATSGKQHGQYEASGVTVVDGYWYIVMDNSAKILKLKPANSGQGWRWNSASLSSLSGHHDEKSDYEAITYNGRSAGNFYVIKEMSLEEQNGEVKLYDKNLTHKPLDEHSNMHFVDDNKGFEGAEWLWHCPKGEPNGKGYILGLCEGNDCTKRKKGTGKLKLLQQVKTAKATSWEVIKSINLPPKFKDYSGIALYPGYPTTCDCSAICDGTGSYTVAVVSQKDSKLWVGELNTRSWSLTNGKSYQFPKDEDGDTIYCNIEGVSILSLEKDASGVTSAEFAIVSDASKKTRCQKKDQSLHIFRLP